MKNINFVKGFNFFVNESIQKAILENYNFDEWFKGGEGKTDSGETEGELMIVADEGDMNGAVELEKALASVDDKGADADLSAGEELLSDWGNVWNHRAKLDSGELTKVGEWYKGKGAWRINSNKADYLGLTPKWMSWTDPLQMDIVEAFFPEVLKGEGSKEGQADQVDDTASDELSNDQMKDLVGGDYDVVDNEHPEMSRDLEHAMAESKKIERLKHVRRIFEADDDFHLGPPKGKTEQEAVVVTPNDLIRRLVRNYKMPHRANIMIWGAPGIGKTQLVNQAAKAIGKEVGKEIPVVIVALSQMQPYDLNGIPLLYSKEGETDFVLKLDKRGEVQMDFAIPAWLPGAGDEDEGILFFDEINNADPAMLAASLTLLLDRKAQKYTMPNGWRVWAAGNRAMDSSAITPMEGRVASRFLGGHLHLVPTVRDWVNWTRSDAGTYKGIDGAKTPHLYVPDEFILFLEQMEDSTADGGKGKKKDDLADVPLFMDRAGKEIKTKFKYFYNYDKASLMSGGEGTVVGFPTPRTWSTAFQNIFASIVPDFMGKVDPDVEDKRKGLAAFTLALNDKEGMLDIKEELESVVGKEATASFLNFVRILAKYSDSSGSLNDKLKNIFAGKDPRPMVGGKKASDLTERQAILGLVESYMGNMGSKMNSTHWTNWMRYLDDLGNNIEEGELSSHLSSVATHNNKEVADSFRKMAMAAQEFKMKGSSSIPKDDAAFILEFLNRFKDVLGSFNF